MKNFSHSSRQRGLVQRNRLLIITIVAVALPSLFVFPGACQGQSTAPGPAAPAAMHDVVDDMGRTVSVPVLPLRIISLAPSLTETVYALGLQDRLVGDTDYCDYPADALRKPKVGGAINPNMEQVAALRPAEIAGLLDERFRLLTGGSRMALPRQQTLRVACR